MPTYSHDEGTDNLGIASGEAYGIMLDSGHSAVQNSEHLDGEISFWYWSRDNNAKCSGTVYFGLFDNSTGERLETIGSHTFTDLTTTPAKYTTTGSGSTTLTDEHAVGMQFVGSGVMKMYKHNNDNYPNGRHWQYDGSSTSHDTNTDARFIFNTSSGSSGGGSGGGGSGGSSGSISGDGGSSYIPEYAMRLNIGYIR